MYSKCSYPVLSLFKTDEMHTCTGCPQNNERQRKAAIEELLKRSNKDTEDDNVVGQGLPVICNVCGRSMIKLQ